VRGSDDQDTFEAPMLSFRNHRADLLRKACLDKVHPVSNWTSSFESERIVRGLVELARAKTADRLLVAGHAPREILLELRRCGFVNAFSTKTCGLPRSKYDVAMVAWSKHSIKTLVTTLDWLVHLLIRTGVLVIWVGSAELGTHQRLRLALDKLGFRIESGSRIEGGVAVFARRVEIVRAAIAA
jgi:hypothetical protein